MKYYKSQQVRQVMGPSGIQETVMNVEVKNGVGTKSVIVVKDGKTRKSVKKLSKKEIKNIGANRFMPGFFTKCLGDCKDTSRSKAKTRKAIKKKRV
jgi:hypothetical protein